MQKNMLENKIDKILRHLQIIQERLEYLQFKDDQLFEFRNESQPFFQTIIKGEIQCKLGILSLVIFMSKLTSVQVPNQS